MSGDAGQRLHDRLGAADERASAAGEHLGEGHLRGGGTRRGLDADDVGARRGVRSEWWRPWVSSGWGGRLLPPFDPLSAARAGKLRQRLQRNRRRGARGGRQGVAPDVVEEERVSGRARARRRTTPARRGRAAPTAARPSRPDAGAPRRASPRRARSARRSREDRRPPARARAPSACPRAAIGSQPGLRRRRDALASSLAIMAAPGASSPVGASSIHATTAPSPAGTISGDRECAAVASTRTSSPASSRIARPQRRHVDVRQALARALSRIAPRQPRDVALHRERDVPRVAGRLRDALLARRPASDRGRPSSRRPPRCRRDRPPMRRSSRPPPRRRPRRSRRPSPSSAAASLVRRPVRSTCERWTCGSPPSRATHATAAPSSGLPPARDRDAAHRERARGQQRRRAESAFPRASNGRTETRPP